MKPSLIVYSVVAMLAACGSAATPVPPDPAPSAGPEPTPASAVTVQAIAAETAAMFTSTVIDVTFRVANPRSDGTLELGPIEPKVAIDGELLIELPQRHVGAKLEPGRSHEFKMRAEVDGDPFDLMSVAIFKTRPTVDVKLTGRAWLETPAGSEVLQLADERELEVQEL